MILSILIPWAVSLSIGFLFLNILFRPKSLGLFLHLTLSLGLGIGLSGFLVFLIFIIAGQFNSFVILGIHVSILCILLFLNIPKFKKNIFSDFPDCHWTDFGAFVLLIAAMSPLFIMSAYYQWGGWDAWQVWNLKTKFLLLGGKNWGNLFDPSLWRSSPHYPLLLPLINVWGSTVIQANDYRVALFTSLIFTSLTANILYFSLKKISQSLLSIIPPLIILTLPIFLKLTSGQYADVMIGFYILAAVICFVLAQIENESGFYVLSAIFLGLLSFVKPEGLIACLILATTSTLLIFFKKNTTSRNIAIAYIFSLGGALIIPFIFYAFYAPKNITFINGLVSAEHPISWLRLQFVFAFYCVELISQKWNGIWIVCIIGLMLSWKKCFRQPLTIIPVFLAGYNAVVMYYYLINTYFKIDWWLQMTLNRILYSVLPLVLWWVFLSVIPEHKKKLKS